MKRFILWLPLAVFLIFAVTFAVSLRPPPEQPFKSKLVGRPLPAFSLPAALPDRPGVDSASFVRGEPRIINIFASWCIPCIAEAPQLMELARSGIPIDAVAVRDRPEDIAAFLARWGDPYQRIGSDRNSRVQLALGSSGVPETFVVDGKGVIRYQHVGGIRPEQVAEIRKAFEAAR